MGGGAEITVEEVSALAKCYSLESSCVLKILEPRGYATAEAMRAAVARVEAAKAAGGIPSWEEEPLPESVVVHEPEEEGVVEAEKAFDKMGAVEVTLGNGMRVCYKFTDFLDDQVRLQSTFGWRPTCPWENGRNQKLRWAPRATSLRCPWWVKD